MSDSDCNITINLDGYSILMPFYLDGQFCGQVEIENPSFDVSEYLTPAEANDLIGVAFKMMEREGDRIVSEALANNKPLRTTKLRTTKPLKLKWVCRKVKFLNALSSIWKKDE